MLDEQSKPAFDEDIDYLETCEKEILKLKANEIYRQVMRKALLKAYTTKRENTDLYKSTPCIHDCKRSLFVSVRT